jgi:hypothetical protein
VRTDTRSKICVSYCNTVDMEKIQSFHVRNIFSLVMPLQTDRLPHLNPNGAPSSFGFTITFPDNPLPHHYRINMYSDFRRGQGTKRTEVTFTSLLEWAKKTPITFKKCNNTSSIEAIELHLRIGPGFDFRKVPKRFVRFEIERFVYGALQNKCISKVCQVLGKRRTLRSSDIEQGEQAKITILLNNYFPLSICSFLDELLHNFLLVLS